MQRVTVMVPSYNYAQYLTECVESAATQPEADVVIVDNGSTDGSPEIGAGLARRHANVRFVRHEHNEGIITSFNRCRDEVRADFAMLLCADDMLVPGSLARSVAFMDAHPRVGLVYGTAVDFADADDVDLAGLPTGGSPPIVHDGHTWIGRLCLTGRNPIRTPEVLMRAAVMDDVGPYEPACPYTSDLNLWLRIAGRSDVGFLPDTVQALFRQHRLNVGKGFPHNSLAELDQRWTAFERFFDATGEDRQRRQWEDRARRTVAAEARYSASRVFTGGGPDDVEELLAFADRIDPAGGGVVERSAWALRRRLGPAASKWFPGFHVRPVVHRTRNVLAERRRRRVGIG